jgi:hypothetical protein
MPYKRFSPPRNTFLVTQFQQFHRAVCTGGTIAAFAFTLPGFLGPQYLRKYRVG